MRTKTVPASATGVAGYSVCLRLRRARPADVSTVRNDHRDGHHQRSTTGSAGFGPRPPTWTARLGRCSTNYDPHGNRTRVTHPDGNVFRLQPTSAADSLMFISMRTARRSWSRTSSTRSVAANDRARCQRGSITTFTPDEISRLASIALNLDGTTTTNDVGIGFSYNPASQVVARSQTNSLYDYQIPVVNQVYTRNGLNQYPPISGTNGGTLG